MGDRIVHLLDKGKPPAGKYAIELVTDESLAEIMQEGYEVVSTMPARTLTVAGKSVKASMMVLRPAGENRGVSVVQEPQQQVAVRDDFGNSRQVSTQEAMALGLQGMMRAVRSLSDGAGHLGASVDHSMPGVSIISGGMVEKARDMGLAAAMGGRPASDCPFPPGSAGGQLWLDGHATGTRKGGSAQPSQGEMAEARRAGSHTAAQYAGTNQEVSCPYIHPALKKAWVLGFREAGGDVT